MLDRIQKTIFLLEENIKSDVIKINKLKSNNDEQSILFYSGKITATENFIKELICLAEYYSEKNCH